MAVAKIDKEELDERIGAIERRLSLMSPRKRNALMKEVANRVNLHRAQSAIVVEHDDNVCSGMNAVGVSVLPRTTDEPESMQSLYPLCTFVDDAGVQKSKIVVLRVWHDWTCKQAIDWNKAMVARVCSTNKPEQLNFSTRMQTDVQTRCIIMWMRLHGKFFWNKEIKNKMTSLYFNSEKKILRKIQSDDFRLWLAAHAQVNASKADFDYLMNEIDTLAMNPECSKGVSPGALFDRRGDVIYVSCGDSYMAKIVPSKDGVGPDKHAIRIVPNGTDDIVFMEGNTLAPWTLEDGPGEDPFECLPPFSTANYQSAFGKMIVRLWFLSVAACQDSFPALLFTGKARSGKSRTAKALCELIGAPIRLAAISSDNSGRKDFWSIINKGGIVCFDNVDTKNDWLSDAMQQACTDGSFESRALYTNDEVSTLRSNARIILTSNNPLFASESGLSDRLQVVRLLSFDGKNGKETCDKELTNIILAHRNLCITWLVRTLSKALYDRDHVEKNVNFRHPDFAEFALRCARVLGMYDDAILALKSAEFDKALITVQSNPTVNVIFESLCYWFDVKAKSITGEKCWSGGASDMLRLILESHPSLRMDDGRPSKIAPSETVIGRLLLKFIDQLSVIFDANAPQKGHAGVFWYRFNGYSEAYLRNVGVPAEEVSEQKNEESDDEYEVM